MTARIDAKLVGDPTLLAQLCRALIDQGEGEKALALIDEAIARSPDDRALREVGAALSLRGVAGFHASMLADGPRNTAFVAAIENGQVAGRRVLDIGAGSGLLAMIAARAGASHVTACEADPMLAATARRIVAANGLADRVTVVAGHSAKLSLEELGGPADVIVTEIFAADVIGEGVLPTMRDAIGRLAASGAAVIPRAASIRVALGSFECEPPAALGDVEGFDLGLFERHLPAPFFLGRKRPPRLCSEPIDLFHIDLADSRALNGGSTVLRLTSSGGPVDGVVQWIALDLAESVTYENAPVGGARSHWAALAWPFDRPIETRAGEEVAVAGWVAHDQLRIWGG